MKNRVVIVCGGTGGHLTPGIAVAQKWIKRGVDCDLIVSKKNIDKTLSDQHSDLNFHVTPGIAFSLHPIRFAKFSWALIKGFRYANRKLKELDPKAVLAFGGFTSVAFGLVAKWRSIPLFIHEANRVPGRAVRLLANICDRVFLPEGIWVRGVSKLKQRACGFPIREGVVHTKKSVIRENLGIAQSLKVLVVVGGSQGAQALNDWVKQYEDLLLAENISVFCITGSGKENEFENKSKINTGGHSVEIRYFPFYEDIGDLYSVADLVISRAGAGSIAELKQCLCPSILIPYPYAADDHQLANAKYHEMKGCCLVVDQSHLGTLYSEVQDFIFNSWLLTKMRDNIRKENNSDPALFIIDEIEAFLQSKDIKLESSVVT